jgi:hypothetical protein
MQVSVARYFFVARIVIIIGVVLLCFSGKQLSARQGSWIWQREKSGRADYTETTRKADSVTRKKTQIKKQKKLVSKNSKKVTESVVETEMVIAQSEPTVPAVLRKNVVPTYAPVTVAAMRAKPVSILENPELEQPAADMGVSCMAQSNSESRCAGRGCCAQQELAERKLSSVDDYWDMLLNPRPWWDLSGQKFGPNQ